MKEKHMCKELNGTQNLQNLKTWQSACPKGILTLQSKVSRNCVQCDFVLYMQFKQICKCQVGSECFFFDWEQMHFHIADLFEALGLAFLLKQPLAVK